MACKVAICNLWVMPRRDTMIVPINTPQYNTTMNSLIQPKSSLPQVHLVQGHDYGTAMFNGEEVPVTEEFLNADETRAYFDSLKQKVHKSSMAFLGIADALDRIEESKLYLCIPGDDGTPLFNTWEEFLQEYMSFGKSVLSKMRSARDGYLWLRDHFAEDTETLKRLPANMNFYYQLDMIPEDRREEALAAVLARNSSGTVTAKMLTCWRNEAKALAAHSGASDKQRIHCLQTEEDGACPTAVNAETAEADIAATDTALEAPALDTLNAVATTTADLFDFSVPLVSEVASQEGASIVVAPESSSTKSDVAATIERMHDPEANISFDDVMNVLTFYLEDEDFIALVAQDAMEHSDRGDLKEGERTARAILSDAFAAFQRGVNQATVDLRAQQLRARDAAAGTGE